MPHRVEWDGSRTGGDGRGGRAGQAEILIDLDVPRPDQPADAAGSRRRGRQWRTTTAAAVAGILVLSAGGAAPAPPPPLQEVHTTPLDAASSYRLIGDLLVTAAPTIEAGRLRQRRQRITGYDLARGRRLWSTEIASDGPTIGLTPADGVLLIRQDLSGARPTQQTTALDLRTGVRRWSVQDWLDPVPGERIGLLFERLFAPESRLTPGQVANVEETYYSTDGEAYREPPIGLALHAVDLETGRTRWESSRWDNAVVVPGAGDQPAILLTASKGQVEVRDLATAEVRHRLDWPGGEVGSADRVGQVVVLSRSGPDPGVTAYSADLRQRRWSRPLTSRQTFIAACAPVLCQSSPFSTSALEPGTGETLWRLPGRVQILSTGSRLIQLDDAQWLGPVFDPLTGREVGRFDGWRLVHDGSSGREHGNEDRPLVLRPDFIAERSGPGLLDLAGLSVRPLGVLPFVPQACEATPRYLACRIPGSQLRVWRLRL